MASCKPPLLKFMNIKLLMMLREMIVMAGAIDIHSHIAGGNVNNARLLSPRHTNLLKIA